MSAARAVALTEPAGVEVGVVGLGPAAERFARNTLRRSADTRRSYRSVYRRFAAFLAERTGNPHPGLDAFTADAVASYLDHLEAFGRATATVRKERAALNRLTRHLQLIGAIPQTVALEILDVEASTITTGAGARPALDEETLRRVKDLAAARVLTLDPTARADTALATRDLAIITVLAELGLRSREQRTARTADLRALRTHSATPWLLVRGKRGRERDLPVPLEAQRALRAWQDARPPEVAENPLLFPRLGRRTRDGTFPEADRHGEPMTGQALSNIVKPLMLAAGVAPEHAHPHVLRHTWATLFLQRRRHDPTALTKCQELLGHASLDTTRVYLHHTRAELERTMREGEPTVLDRAEGARRQRNRRRAGPAAPAQ